MATLKESPKAKGKQQQSDQPDDDFLSRSKLRCDYSRKYDNSVNTGPKGVIKDFLRYKQFEDEKRKTQDKLTKMKRLSLQTSRPYPDEKVDRKQSVDDTQVPDDENDPLMKEYIAKRMREMLERYQQREVKKVFGHLAYLPDRKTLLTILADKDLKNILIISHVYNHQIRECKTMNGCLDKLAQKYPHVKFCCLEAGIADKKHDFIKNDTPALLVHKNGDLVANFVSLDDEFGDKFDENDVEDFLSKTTFWYLVN